MFAMKLPIVCHTFRQVRALAWTILGVALLLGQVPLAGQVAVSINPASANVLQGGKQQFTATVTGTTNTAVTWSVSSKGGAITTAGLYTAPVVAGTYTVTAKSAVDTKKIATATITVPALSIAIDPVSATVPVNRTRQFTATVTGAANTAVTWSVSRGGGTISTSGLYTPPTTPGTYTVTATSKANTTKKASATVKVIPAVSVSLDTSTLRLAAGAYAQTISAKVSGGTVSAVAWSCDGGAIMGVSAETDGSYATYRAGAVGGTFTVTATSTEDPLSMASAKVYVASLGVNPGLVDPGQTVNLLPTFPGTGAISPGVGPVVSGSSYPLAAVENRFYTLSVADPEGGSITAQRAVRAGLPGRVRPLDSPYAGTIKAGDLLSDGSLLLVGNRSGGWATLFNPADRSFVDLGPMPTSSWAWTPTVTALEDGRALIVWGWLEKTSSGNVDWKTYYLFDPVTRTLTGTQSDLAQRSGHTATRLLDGRVLITGGTKYSGYISSYSFNDAVLFDPVKSAFTDVRYFPDGKARTGHRALLLKDGKVLLTGGGEGALLFEPGANTFTAANGLGVENGVTALLPDGKVFIARDPSTEGSLPKVWDPETGTTAAMPDSMADAVGIYYPTNGAALPNGLLLGFGKFGLGYFDPVQGRYFSLKEDPNLELDRDPFAGILISPLRNGDHFIWGIYHQTSGAYLYESSWEVTLSPAHATVRAGQSVKLVSASPSGEVPVLQAFGGTLAPDGTFTAQQGGLYAVTATLANGRTATSWIRVIPPLSVAIQPGAISVNPGGAYIFSAILRSATTTAGVTWSIREGGSGGAIDASGNYTAPLTGGVFHIVATSAEDPTRSATAVVVVEKPVYLSPLTTHVAPGNKATFTLHHRVPVSDSSVTWSSDGGSVDVNGTFTAPLQPGEYAVTATTAAGQARAKVVVGLPPVIEEFRPDPEDLAPGGSGVLLWSVAGASNPALSGWGSVQPVDWAPIMPTGAALYTLSAANAFGSSSASITLKPGAPKVASFRAEVPILQPGGSTALQWETQGATTLRLDPGNLEVTGRQGTTVAPSSSTAYTLTATNAAGTASRAITVIVSTPPQITSFTASPEVVSAGAAVTLSWQVVGASAVYLDPAGTSVYPQGSTTVWPSRTTTYTLRAIQGSAVTTRSLTITVPTTPPEILRVSASPAVIAPGGTSTLSWEGSGVINYRLDPGTLILGRKTSYAVSPSGTTTYTLTAYNDVGSVQKTVTVKVSPVTSLSVSPNAVVLYPSQAATFGYSITSTGSLEVTWSASGGTLTPSGPQASYVAPAEPGVYTVTATAVADPTMSASATVQVIPPDVTLALSPSALRLTAGASASLNGFIQVTGSSNTGITWSANGGMLLEKGGSAFYTAPLVPGTYLVQGASTANPAVSASTVVEVTAPSVAAPALSLRPSALTLAPGQRVFLGTAYEVADPGTGLAWNAGGGTLQVEPSTGSAIYTAPLEPGTYGVTVSGVLHPELSASAVITVQEAAPSSFRVSPASATLRTGHSMLLEATDAQGRILSRVRWAVQEANGGIVTPAGQYRAPLTAGTYHVVVASLDDPSLTATAALTVVAGGGGGSGGGGGETYTPMSFGLTVTPDKAEIPAGTYQALSAVVEGLDDQGVTWEIVGAPGYAEVDEQGTFKASLPGAYQVQATSKADTQLWGTAVITVVSSVKPIEGAPVASSLEGYSVTALKDGRILIAGGFDGTQEVASARIYDPEQKTFTDLPPMTLPRAHHTATLLDDGRVLLAGGQCRTCGWPVVDNLSRIQNAEVFDPATNSFRELPTNPGYAQGNDKLPGRMRFMRERGDSVLLGNGQVLHVGGRVMMTEDPVVAGSMDWDTWDGIPRPSDLFTPGADTFDLSNDNPEPYASPKWLDTENCFPTSAQTRVVALADGTALMTGGVIPPVVNQYRHPCGVDNPTGEYLGCTFDQAWNYVPGLGRTRVGNMIRPRWGHTMTLLPNGKVLIVGGAELYTYIRDPKAEGAPGDTDLSTSTAELYDPETGRFTLTGSLHDARAMHAALLLPTGKVLIVGGKNFLGDGTWTYPKTMELYDPETGKFEVMETLEYGLEGPKVALLPDGDTFITGTIQGVVEPTTASPGAGGYRGGFLAGSSAASFTNGTAVVFQGATANRIRIVASINQGVERYLSDADQAEFAAPPYPWRSGVPIVGKRGARLRIRAFGSTAKVQDVSIEVKLNGRGLPLSTQTMEVQRGIPSLGRAIEQGETPKVAEAILQASDLNTSYGDSGDPRQRRVEVEVVLKKDGKVLGETDRLPPIAPMVRLSRPFKVYVQAMSYQRPPDASGNLPPVDEVPSARMTEIVRELSNNLPRLYPVSEGSVEVREIAVPDKFVWEEQERGKILDGNQWRELNSKVWPYALKNKLNIWDSSDPGKPENSHRNFYLLVVPSVEGGTTKAGNSIGGICALGEHFPCVFASGEPGWSAELHSINVVLHELGHGHGAMHARPERTASIPGSQSGGCAAIPKVAQGPDPNWPTTGRYQNARIGVPGYDLLRGSALDFYGFADVMTYCDQKWVSDYSFRNWWIHNEARPEVPIDLDGPTVNFISPTPADSAKVSGPFRVALEILDESPNPAVTYRINGMPARTLPAPYVFEVDPATLPMDASRTIWIEVTAIDAAGRSGLAGRPFEYVPPSTQ